MQPASQRRVNRLGPALLIILHLLFNRNTLIPVEVSESLVSPVNRAGEDEIVIAQVSDLHLNTQVGRAQRRAARALNQLDPDIVLITGDSIGSEAYLPALEKWLASLKVAKNARFAVLGNWEYLIRHPEQTLDELYSRNGTSLLINKSVELEIKGRSLRIVGLDDYLHGNISETAFQGSDETVIELIMVHEPVVADYIAERVSGAYIFSGHTHGGQIRILGRTLYTPPGSGRFVEGSYIVGDNLLIVSRGVGASTIRIRSGPEPDIRILRLPAGE